ncbi:putative rRNA maturation factor [Phenylobacterium haematophilum]|uniref:Endoribonuclease YbeY n=1 Tax=Phenylobacterium haematophilum TaxID=98513 RepID=A0A840A167_9CAUL|nr:rRNA maturation RNase YbeY [Phenylobacterium haematophilum]MBB3892665.1 putative rRNA maturation factor [Phenylobacterium haematophilum]
MIDIEIEDEAWVAAAPQAQHLVEAAAAAALRHAEFDVDAVTILLTDDESVRDLNDRFRGKDYATNVLSFPAPENPEGHLGDIALAFGVCAREATEQGKPLGHHLQHLVAHGVLHLLGYDHETDAEAEHMEGLERVILAGLGVPDPYAAEQGDHG